MFSNTLPLTTYRFAGDKRHIFLIDNIQVVSVMEHCIDHVLAGQPPRKTIRLTEPGEPGCAPYVAMRINNGFWIITDFNGWRQFQPIADEFGGPLVIDGTSGYGGELTEKNGVVLSVEDLKHIGNAIGKLLE